MKIGFGVTCCLMASAGLLVSCGGTSSSSSSSSVASGNISIVAAVSSPSSGGSSIKGFFNPYVNLAITETDADGVEVKCMNLSGTVLGTCTTSTDGSCEIQGLTETQVRDGVILAAAGETIHALDVPEASEITAERISVAVNTESTLSYATSKSECDGHLDDCATVDVGGLADAVTAFVGDSEIDAATQAGYAEVLLQATSDAIFEGQPAADLLVQAFDGNLVPLEAVVGASVSGVSISDAVTNTKSAFTLMKDSYFVKTDAGSSSLAQTLKGEASNYNVSALVGVFKKFTPAEMINYKPADFQSFASALPSTTNGFTGFIHPEAQWAGTEQFRLGAFRDPAKVGVAMGLLTASFPTDLNFSTNAYDPSTAARAANNAFLQYASAGGDFTINPATIAQQFAPVMGDASYRQSWAIGGSTASSSYISGFVSNYTAFVPTDHLTSIIKPPGAACTADADCVPCHSCANSICVSISSKVGVSCASPSDCDAITTCMGAFYVGARGACSCTGAIPQGASVYTAAAGSTDMTPQHFGSTDTGGYIPPTGGSGTSCGGTSGVTCSSGTSCSAGICIASTFKKGPYMPCVDNIECESDTCTSGVCMFGSTAPPSGSSAKTIGLACGAPSECISYCCKAAVCAEASQCSSVAGATLFANGLSCTGSSQCQSAVCCGSPMTCQASYSSCTVSDSTTTLLANDLSCTIGTQCQSGICCGSPLMTCEATYSSCTVSSGDSKVNGAFCSYDSECQSNHCVFVSDLGYQCQP